MQQTVHTLTIISLIIFVQIEGYSAEKKETSSKLRKPYESPDLFEGDMLFHGSPNLNLRGIARRVVAWTDGIIPYEFDSGIPSWLQEVVISVMQKMERLIAINNVACVQFRPKLPDDRYYIEIIQGWECYSSIGQGNSPHIVSLFYPDCFREGNIMHELLHTLGFFHEQSRPDRDNYIRILYENIANADRHNFEKYNDTSVNTLDTSYDYSSIMHYERNAFSQNGLPTIEPLQVNVTIGQRDNMSSTDIQEVRLLYNCSATGVTLPEINATTTQSQYSVNTTVVSAWTTSSRKCIRYSAPPTYPYYEAYRVTVPINGSYVFMSSSKIDTYGYLYLDSFSPTDIKQNLILENDDDGGNDQFQFETTLETNCTYILVITPYQENITGEYRLIILGLTSVNITLIDETSATLVPSTTTNGYVTTSSKSVLSHYFGELTTDFVIYNRENISGIYYYNAIRINVPISGDYDLSSDSTVDTYGYLYINSFNPQDMSFNLLAKDDNNGGNNQFSISYKLHSSVTYILITTTYSSNTTGNFGIQVRGPTEVIFSALNQSSSTARPSPSPTSTRVSASVQLNIGVICFISQLLVLYIIHQFLVVH